MFQVFSLNQPKEAAINRLKKAAAMASRLIARRASSFRVQPSFSHFRKMNTALCRLQELNMHSEIDGMHNAIKSSCQVLGAYHLPTATNFRYFLIWLQSYAKLLVRIIVCAKESHRLFLRLVHRSAFVEIMTMFMAVTAQIWTECVAIGKAVARLYNALFSFFKEYFESEAHEGLPENLMEWLGDDWKEHIAVKSSLNAVKVQKHQSNIILFNVFDVKQAKQVQPLGSAAVDGGEVEPMKQKPVTPKFTPKLILNTHKRPINLNDPSKLSQVQQYRVKYHQKKEKKMEEKLRHEIKAMQNKEKKVQIVALTEPPPIVNSNATTMDMGERIERGAFGTHNKIV